MMKGRKWPFFAITLAALISLSACSMPLGKKSDFNPTESSAYVDSDGAVLWADVEAVEGDFSEDELLDFAQKRISAYNASQGAVEAAANESRGEKLPVAIVDVGLEKGQAVLITEYDAPERLLAFAGEIGDTNVKFTRFETGSAESMSEVLSSATLFDVTGKPVTDAAQDAGLVIVVEGEGIIHTQGKVLYVSEGCTLNSQNRLRTAADGTHVIVLKE